MEWLWLWSRLRLRLWWSVCDSKIFVRGSTSSLRHRCASTSLYSTYLYPHLSSSTSTTTTSNNELPLRLPLPPRPPNPRKPPHIPLLHRRKPLPLQTNLAARLHKTLPQTQIPPGTSLSPSRKTKVGASAMDEIREVGDLGEYCFCVRLWRVVFGD